MGTDGISGSDLMIKSFSQAEKYGAEFIFDEVTGVFPDESKAVLKGGDVKYKSLILAVGTYDRKTGVENEKDFIGRGVSYCAVCDGNFFKGKTVVVAGAATPHSRTRCTLRRLRTRFISCTGAKVSAPKKSWWNGQKITKKSSLC